MITAEDLSTKLETRYRELLTLVEEEGDLETQIWKARADLSDERARLLRCSDPKELGSNEAQRNANIDGLCVVERGKVAEIEHRKLELRPKLEMARLRVEEARAQLRLLEVAAGGRAER